VDAAHVRRDGDVVELRPVERLAHAIVVPPCTGAQLPREILVQPLAVFDEVRVAVLIACPAISVALFCAKACAQSSLTVTPWMASESTML
jgi:hypothetical protein